MVFFTSNSQSTSFVRFIAFIFLLLVSTILMETEAKKTAAEAKSYDVFLSFSGSDIRLGFLSHLSDALRRKQIVVFIDNQIHKGDEISESLLQAIDKSLISLVIFSPNYVKSHWCMSELIRIVECRKKVNQVLLPVFYKVDPSDVRWQKGPYADPFLEHEKQYNLTTVKKWRSALTQSASILGFHSSLFKDEAVLIEKIVQRVLRKLDDIHKDKARSKRVLIRLENQISHVESLLMADSKDVRAIGIWGMAGIGKTTIAEEVYSRQCSKYDACYFKAKVREEWKRHGSMNLKNELFSTLLGQQDLKIYTTHGLPYFVDQSWRFPRIKVLVVLDDVNDQQQLEILIGSTFDRFGRGSRIIISTRDKQVLAKRVDDNDVYEVKPLDFQDSFRLFILTLSEQNHPKMNFYEHELSKKVVNYAKGIPLVLKELGYFIGGKDKSTWKSQFEKLKRVPLLKNVHDAIRLSCEDLSRVEKKVLLDIASLSDGLYLKVDNIRLLMNVDNIQLLLKDVDDYNLVDVLQSLRNKALLSISQHNVVSMHSIIQVTAREIVREESNEDQGKQSDQLLEPIEKGCVSLKTVSFPSTAVQILTENKTRVFLWNCLKLDEPSLNAIGLNARINMMNFAFGNHYDSQATYVYPGSNVPAWLEYKTTSDYMTIDLSQYSFDHLGFIFCFIVPEVESHGSILRFNIAIIGCEDEYIQVYLDRTSHGIQSDHVYLMCNRVLSRYIISRLKNQPKLEMRVTAETGTLTSEYVPLMLLKGFGISPVNTSQYNHFSEQMELDDGPSLILPLIAVYVSFIIWLKREARGVNVRAFLEF